MNGCQTLKRATTAGLVLVLAACANLPRPFGGEAPAPSGSGAPAAEGSARPPAQAVKLFADDKSNRYVRLDATNTGLLTVADDGQNTFAAFAIEPRTVEVFNEDGKPIRSAFSKKILAIEGKHQGLLFTSPLGNSFSAPNTRVSNTLLEALLSDPDVTEARSLLEGKSTQMAAYQRALALASTKSASGSGVTGRPSEPGTTQPPASATPAPAPAVGGATPPPGSEDATYVRLDKGVLMRVFFASGGRSIVRPDDGLARLNKEAQAARLIRITGYTDNLGNASWNSLLARQRAEAIRNHLIKAGIAPERIVATWPGATDFLAENASEKGRALNRRVEVMLMQP